MTYSTFLGGTSDDSGEGVAAKGPRFYIVGATASTGFPTKNPFQGTYQGGSFDAFVVNFNMPVKAKMFYFGRAVNIEE